MLEDKNNGLLNFANERDINGLVDKLSKAGMGVTKGKFISNYVGSAIGGSSMIRRDDLKQRIATINNDISGVNAGNLDIIRQTSNELYNRKGFYWSCVQFICNLMTLDYLLVPRFGFTEEKEDVIKKAMMKAQEYCEDILEKSQVREMLKDIVIDGCYFGVERQDGKSYYMQKLDNEYCRRGTLIVKGLPTVEYNFSYFDDKDEEHFELFPSEFQTLYNEYLNNVDDKEEPEWRMLNPESSICLFTEDSRVPLPMFTRLFPELLEAEEYFNNLAKVNENDTFKLLHQQIPYDVKNGMTKMSSLIAGQFHEAVKNLVPDGVDVATTPLEIKEIKTNVNKSEREVGIDKINERLHQTAGITPYILSSAQNVSGINANINHNTNIISSILEKFEFWLKKRLDRIPPVKYRFKVEFLKTNTINREDMFAMHEKLLSYGGAIEPLLSIAGINPHSYIGLLEMEKMLKIKEKLEITQSVHTANTSDNKGGRPSDKNSETGEESKDKGTNEEKGMI